MITDIKLKEIVMPNEDNDISGAFGINGTCLMDGKEKYCAMQFSDEDMDRSINELRDLFVERLELIYN